MKKVLVFAVVGAVAGTMIGSVASGVVARKASAAVVDTTKVPSHAAASTPELDTAVAPAPETVPPAIPVPIRTALDTATAPIVRASIDMKVVDTLAQRAGRLAKLFSAMPARDAAKVLSQLDDVDVQRIIARVSDRQAAAILSNFPPDRAAAVARLALGKAIP
jgi:hypothetical protein